MLVKIVKIFLLLSVERSLSFCLKYFVYSRVVAYFRATKCVVDLQRYTFEYFQLETDPKSTRKPRCRWQTQAMLSQASRSLSKNSVA